MTTQPCASSHSTGRISTIRFGSGEGTTRRQLAPSCRTTHPRRAASSSAASAEYTGPTNLVGLANAGSSGSTWVIVSMVASGLSAGSRLPSSCSMR